MFIELVMPSNHLILCCSFLLLPSIFPSVRVFSNKSVLCIRWPKCWSFSFNISPSNEYWGLISFRIDWFDILAVQGTLKSLLQYHSSKTSILWCSAFFSHQIRSVTQSCLTLSNPTDCSLPGSSAHGIFQARVLEWGATAFSGWLLLLWMIHVEVWQKTTKFCKAIILQLKNKLIKKKTKKTSLYELYIFFKSTSPQVPNPYLK